MFRFGFARTAERALSQTARLRSFRLTVAALLLVSVPAVWVAVIGLVKRLEKAPGWADAARPDDPLMVAIVVAGAALMLVSSWLVMTRRRAAAWVCLPAAFLSHVPAAFHARLAPGLALAGWGWAAALVYMTFRQSRFLGRSEELAEDDDPRAVVSLAVLVSSAYALLIAGWSAGVGLMQDTGGRVAITALMAAAAGIACSAEWSLVRRELLPRRVAIILTAVSAAGALGVLPIDERVFDWAPLVLGLRLAASVGGSARAHELRSAVLGFLWARPALLVVLTFAALSLVGGLVLTFPACSAHDRPLDPIDALFTAVSACCVTGLTVQDTAQDFSGLGQLVILALIQVGALGIMTLSALATVLLGGRLAGRTEGALSMVVGTDSRGNAARLLRPIAMATLAIELVGALLLLPAFVGKEDSFGAALWNAVFHSVSAFCNAGFALQSDSLVGWNGNPLVLHVIAILILLGGAGFGVLFGLRELWLRRAGLQVKLVVASNLALLGVAFVVWLLLEWNGVLDGLGFAGRVNNAWFQAVTLRTAGFSSVDYDGLSHATIIMMIVWMFVGASPGSTGGGVKTTTVAVLIAAVVSVVRGRPDAEAFGRRIPQAVVYRAAALVTISATIVFAGSFALMMTQGFAFDSVLFEAVSAFGTVGLSLGITAEFDRVGKLLIMVLMFVGRTGPLTMVLLFRRRDPAPTRYPEEEVMVG